MNKKWRQQFCSFAGIKCHNETPECYTCGTKGWFNHWDLCGLICATISIGVTVVTNYVTVHFIIVPWFRWSALGVLHFVLYETLFFMIIWSHSQTMCSSPGVTNQNVVSQEAYDEFKICYLASDPLSRRSMTKICRHCLNYKAQGVHHCSVCQRCVQRMDHHCPWVNNCVGRRNQKFFILFIIYVFLGEGYSLCLAIGRGLVCLPKSAKCGDPMPPFGLLICLVVSISSIFFFAFVVAMGCDQWEAVRDDLTYIDRKQNAVGREITMYQGICEVFGSKFNIKWFVPLPEGKNRYRRVK